MPISNLRLATEEDIPEIVVRAKKLHEQSKYRPIAFSPEVTTATAYRAIREGIVIMGDTGAIMGLVICPHFSAEPIAAEIMWYAEAPRERRDLFHAFAYWARNVAKVKNLSVSTLDESNYFVRQGNKTEVTYLVSLT